MLEDLARKILPSALKDVLQVEMPWRLQKLIRDLDIAYSGVSEDGIPFITLTSGKVFYSFFPTGVETFIYSIFMGRKLKNRLKKDCFRVALDTLFRYKGSTKASLSTGKYYDYKAGDTVVECGAYIGYYAMKASEIVGETGRVIAVEAIPENIKILEKNLTENKINNITVIGKGIWKGPTELEISRDRRQRASLVDDIVASKEKIKIPCDSIDNILEECGIHKARFVRIQVNGAELEALEGMKKTMPEIKTVLVSALYKRDGVPVFKTVDRILTEQGFTTKIQNGNVLAERV